MKYHIFQLVKRLLPIFTLLFFCINTYAAQTIVFSRDNSIWMAKIDGSNSVKLTKGSEPSIAPNGLSIAFTSSSNNTRGISIIEIASKKIALLNHISSDNSFNPSWSHDNKTLLFSTYINNEWQLALINADDTNYRLIPNTKNFYTAIWSNDGKSFFAQNLTSIVEFDLNGKQLRKWSLNSLTPKGSMNSSSRMSIAPNGAALLFEADMEEAHHFKNWDGAPPALWLLDLSNNKATRVTKAGILAWYPCWINATEFAFISQSTHEKQPSIYRSSIKTNAYQQLIKNARSVSISN